MVDYSKPEKELVDEYLRHVVSISCSLEEKLEKAGVDTLGTYEFSQFLKWELLEHFNANKKNVLRKIADGISGKNRENDIEIIKYKANGYFDGRMEVSETKISGATYLSDRDIFEVSIPTICAIATGGGRDIAFHELRHSEKKHVYSTLFVEGDADYAAMEALCKPTENINELLENYIATENTIAFYAGVRNKGADLDELYLNELTTESLKIRDKISSNADDIYNHYLFSSAVIHFLRTKGFEGAEIKKFFTDVNGNRSSPRWGSQKDRKRILDEIASIRLSSATSQVP